MRRVNLQVAANPPADEYVVGFDWGAKEAWRSALTAPPGQRPETVPFTALTVNKNTDEVVATWCDQTKNVIHDLPHTELTVMLKARYSEKSNTVAVPWEAQNGKFLTKLTDKGTVVRIFFTVLDGKEKQKCQIVINSTLERAAERLVPPVAASDLAMSIAKRLCEDVVSGKITVEEMKEAKNEAIKAMAPLDPADAPVAKAGPPSKKQKVAPATPHHDGPPMGGATVVATIAPPTAAVAAANAPPGAVASPPTETVLTLAPNPHWSSTKKKAGKGQKAKELAGASLSDWSAWSSDEAGSDLD